MLGCGSNNHDQGHDHQAGARAGKPWYRTLRGLATTGLLAIMAYYLWTEHRAHTIAFLPFGLLLLCPLMHLFHGHGGHNHGGSEPVAPPNLADKSAGATKSLLS